MSALGLHQLILPPSGVEYATILKLTPSTVSNDTSTSVSGRALYNIVLARSNYLRIYEVREEPVQVNEQKESEREKKAGVRRGTEAVEGEVEMDEGGEGFVNVGSVKPTSATGPTTSTKFHFVREHILHGTITGMQRVRVLSSVDDQLDRLIVSFKDAKIALLEWSQGAFDLMTVSIHTYERTPQVMAHDYPFQPLLRTDPESRCAALLLPQNTLAILPFYQSQADIDVVVEGPESQSDVPYSPSFLLNLHGEVDSRIENVIDFVFLPGFNQPTVAVLFEPQRTWTGRLHENKDTMKVFFFILDSMKRNYPVITAVEGLPSDCLALSPSPAALGGVVVHAANSLIHIDQAQRKIGLPVNGWASRVTDMPMLPTAYADRTLTLEGAFSVFADDRTLFVIHQDGTVYPVEFSVENQIVLKLSMGEPVARTTMPSVACRVDENHVFVGSDVGPSVLLRIASVEELIKEEEKKEEEDVKMETDIIVDKAPEAMNVDDDDIYGPSGALAAQDSATAVTAAPGVKTRTVLHASLCDAIPGRGPIADAAFSVAKNGEKVVPELIAATGAGELGGFTLFQRDLPSRTKRKLHPVGGARGVWALPVRQAVKVNGSSIEKPVNPLHAQNDTVLISTDHNPSPGLSRISTRTGAEGVTVKIRIPGMTIGAAPFFNATAILHVMSNAIRLLEPDGTQRQIIEDLDKNVPRAKIKHCSIQDPFVLILREDETIGLFIGELERGKIRRKDMSPMGDKTSRYIAGSFFNDTTGLFTTRATKAPDEPSRASSTTTLQGVMSASEKTQWLMLCRPQGVMEIWSLPKLMLVFSSTSIASLQSTLVDSYDPPALSVPQDTQKRVPQDFDVEQVSVAPMGEGSPLLHLLVFLRSGDLAVYQALPALDLELPAEPPESRTTFLGVRFVKLLSQAYDIQRPAEEDRSILAEQRRILRQFIPFTTSPAPGATLSGVFFTGDHPSWILRTDLGGLRIHPSGHAVVNSLTTCSLWGLKSDFLVYSDEGPTVLEWVSGVDISGELPSRFVPRGKSYSHVVYEPTSGLVVASAVLRSDFSTFDEENNEVWEPDAPNVAYPKTDASALELLTSEGWVALDGYDFAYNEIVNVMECVPLETLSTSTGRKNYIAVATTVNRGEDLAAKGATYVFEVMEVNPDPAAGRARSWKLRLRCRDDAKGPVTALCGIDNYLVSSMGQKIFIRALDLDERLVGVAFLDIGVYVTSLRAMKNLLLIGDAVKSLTFVAFQEDPYKLTVLARDNQLVSVTSIDFFFTENALSLVTCDEEGIVRMYEYSPQDPEARNGLQLLCRTEFHAHTEYRSSLSIARRSKNPQASPIPQSKLICAHPDGALTALTPVDEDAFKRLFLLQGQLARNVQHAAGLNPRAFRTVQNPTVAKPLARGVLDGTLLAAFAELSLAKQEEITRQIGTERGLIVRDLAALAGPW